MGLRSCCCSCPWWPIHTQKCATWKNKRWKNYSFFGEFFYFGFSIEIPVFVGGLCSLPLSLARSLLSLSLSLSLSCEVSRFHSNSPSLSRGPSLNFSLSLLSFSLSLFFLSLSLFSFLLSLARTLLSLLFLSHFLARYRYFTLSLSLYSFFLSFSLMPGLEISQVNPCSYESTVVILDAQIGWKIVWKIGWKL